MNLLRKKKKGGKIPPPFFSFFLKLGIILVYTKEIEEKNVSKIFI